MNGHPTKVVQSGLFHISQRGTIHGDLAEIRMIFNLSENNDNPANTLSSKGDI